MYQFYVLQWVLLAAFSLIRLYHIFSNTTGISD